MPQTLVLDANLLILLIVGLTDETYVSTHKRTREYTPHDYHTLRLFIDDFQQLAVTPNALTEASNHLRHTDDFRNARISSVFKDFVSKVTEVCIPSIRACEREEFVKLGLSDAALLHLAHQRYFILTSDLDLYLAAISAGYEADNFTHYTEAAGV